MQVLHLEPKREKSWKWAILVESQHSSHMSVTWVSAWTKNHHRYIHPASDKEGSGDERPLKEFQPHHIDQLWYKTYIKSGTWGWILQNKLQEERKCFKSLQYLRILFGIAFFLGKRPRKRLELRKEDISIMAKNEKGLKDTAT